MKNQYIHPSTPVKMLDQPQHLPQKVLPPKINEEKWGTSDLLKAQSKANRKTSSAFLF